MNDSGTTPRPSRDWTAADYDACLHLLDRQVIDVDGRLVGKVDDIELIEDAGALVPTGLLVGLGALLPRFGSTFGPWLEDRYDQLSIAHATRRAPSVIDVDLVAEVGSGITLTAPRAGLLMPRLPAEAGPPHRRLAQLLGMAVDVTGGDLPRRAQVLDVRLVAHPDRPGRNAVDALIVGVGRPGALLGYDRRRAGRPWPVAAVVRRLHRHTRLVRWADVARVDWPERTVRVASDADLRPLL